MNLGAHMSIAGGVYKALERAESIDCHTVQIFTKNQTRWAAPDLKDPEIARFHQLTPKFFSLFAHASYLINLASPDGELYRKSVDNLAEELRRCRILGLGMLVLHPGFHKGQGLERGILQIARGIQQAREQAGSDRVAVLLETTSGLGTAIGSRFEHLRDILAELERRGVPAGVCLDTCHIFAAGYDLRNAVAYQGTWRDFEDKIGLAALRAIHLNDSKGELGSGKDRHEHIGRGRIGTEGFRLIMRDPRLGRIPMSLETPKGPEMREDVENLALLRSLRE